MTGAEQSHGRQGHAGSCTEVGEIVVCRQGWHCELIQTEQKQADYSQLKDKYTAKEEFNLLVINTKKRFYMLPEI